MKILITYAIFAIGLSLASAQIPAPQIALTGNIGCQGFPCINNGTLIFTSDANHTMTARETSAFYIKVTSSVSLTATRNLIAPLGNFPFTIENATTGGQSIQIIGASGTGVTIPNGATVAVWNNGTDYVQIGGGGVSHIVAGTNVTISPSGGTGTVTINAVGNVPSNAVFAFTGTSINDDDHGQLSPPITIVGWHCDGTECTFANTGANELYAGAWVSVRNVGGWFAPPSYLAIGTGYTLFQVNPGYTSGGFSFNYTLNTGSGTGGTAALANFNLPFSTTAQGLLKGKGTTVMLLPNPVNLAGLASNYSSMFHAMSPVVSGNYPEYLIINNDDNDAQSCVSPATTEASYQSIWQQAHEDGWIVVVGSGTAFLANQELSSCNVYQNWIAVEQWLFAQGVNAANLSAGTAQYWDVYADIGGVIDDGWNTSLIAQNAFEPAGANLASSILSNAIASGLSDPMSKKGFYFAGPPGNYNTNNDGFFYVPSQDSGSAFTWSNAAQTSNLLKLDTAAGNVFINPTAATYIGGGTGSSSLVNIFSSDPNGGIIYTVLNSAMTTGQLFTDFIGHDVSTNNAVQETFNYAGAGSASNSFNYAFYGGPYYALWFTAAGNTGINLAGAPAYPFDVHGLEHNDTGYLGPTTAPSGSCSNTGEWAFSQDNAITHCVGGIWTTYSAGGSFTAGGDLGGTSTSQTVLGLTHVTNAAIPVPVSTPSITSPAASSATDSASLGPELTTSGTCSGTGWTGTYPNYIAPGTTAPLTCTGFTSGSYYQLVTGITGNTGLGTVTVAIGTAQPTTSAATATSTLTTGPLANAASLTYTPTAPFNGTIAISAKLISPITTFSYTGKDSTGAVSTTFLYQGLASLGNIFAGGGLSVGRRRLYQ